MDDFELHSLQLRTTTDTDGRNTVDNNGRIVVYMFFEAGRRAPVFVHGVR